MVFIIAIFFNYLRVLEKEYNLAAAARCKSNISIAKAHQTATRNGVKEWSLDAASVDYMTKKNLAIFHDLSVTFYLKDKTEIYLTANQGIIKTDSSDMEVFGNVVVKNGSYMLKTENLHYKHNRRIIFSKVPVKITGDAFDLVADSVSLNLNTNKTIFEGKVEGTLSEKIAL